MEELYKPTHLHHRGRCQMMYQRSILMVPKATIWRSYIIHKPTRLHHRWRCDSHSIQSLWNITKLHDGGAVKSFTRIKNNSRIAIIQYISQVLTICLHYKWIILLPCFGIAVTAIPRFGQFYSPNPQ